jgi:hypothetical protein
VSTAKRYVLCQVSARRHVFVGGADPRLATFHRDDPAQAQCFATAEDALAYRSRMRRQLGGAPDPYEVYELTTEGQLIRGNP